jgi:hypothetical protein
MHPCFMHRSFFETQFQRLRLCNFEAKEKKMAPIIKKTSGQTKENGKRTWPIYTTGDAQKTPHTAKQKS